MVRRPVVGVLARSAIGFERAADPLAPRPDEHLPTMLTFEPRLEILPRAQREIWASLRAAGEAGFVLYGGTAIALQLGHRTSVDFDFFAAEQLDKNVVRTAVPRRRRQYLAGCAQYPGGHGSHFGRYRQAVVFRRIAIGRVADPRWTDDGIMLVASAHDLMATKLKTILDRAEARGLPRHRGDADGRCLACQGSFEFQQMFHGEPGTVLKALGISTMATFRPSPPRR